MSTNTTPLRARALTTLYYGAFLIFAGLMGYASNPEAAKTALMSGSIFGTIFLLFGFGMLKGVQILRWIAVGVAIPLGGIFVWRATVSWQAVANGEPKQVAAGIISAMLIATLALLLRLVRK
ncbi:MAG: hypothetical protein LR015_00250 [Verrucomicrobia bacterium]|nr:hypothetical protein [Verrucomicrobiota bacterium]